VIKRFDDPLHESYDRHQLKLHDRVGPILTEWADIILFATQEVFVKTKEQRFNKKINKAAGGNRVLFTVESPAYVAGNRYGLPEKIPLSWDAFIEAYTAAMTAEGIPPVETEEAEPAAA